MIQGCRFGDEDENEVEVLDLISRELSCDVTEPGKDPSERLAR
jgi:hypothetical protein